MSRITRMECQACGSIPFPGGMSHPKLNDSPKVCHGPVVAVEYVPAEELQGAVCLTDAERERVLWWLHRPVPPGPMKELDVAIIRKLNIIGGRSG